MASSAPDLTSRLLRHERLIVAAGVSLLVVLSWWYVASGAGLHVAMDDMRPPLGALVVMWWLMMVAMMLPSATPALLLYAQVRQIRSRDADIAATWVFLAGYLGVWLLFSVAAAVAQSLLTGPSMPSTTTSLRARRCSPQACTSFRRSRAHASASADRPRGSSAVTGGPDGTVRYVSG